MVTGPSSVPGGGKRVMSGMRPTGRLHLGNYWGALKSWVELQDRYDCYFAAVDWHMLTTGYQDTRFLQEHIREMVLDWLAAGVDPEKCVMFKQSSVPEHAELALLLSMITPLSWLENNPTWKEQLQELARTKDSLLREQVRSIRSAEKRCVREGAPVSAPAPSRRHEDGGAQTDESLRTHGFLGYPVLQAADILLYGGELVPVGQDQVPHLELARDIAARFNALYGPVLSRPQPLLAQTPKMPGLDARKMSKSYGNAVDILETPESLRAKVMSMYTDPGKARAGDPGHPEPCPENPPGCAVFALHKLYSSYAGSRDAECRQGRVGCVACKKDLLGSLEGPFGEFRERRGRWERRAGVVEELLAEGGRKAREEAARTLGRVRRAMHLA